MHSFYKKIHLAKYNIAANFVDFYTYAWLSFFLLYYYVEILLINIRVKWISFSFIISSRNSLSL